MTRRRTIKIKIKDRIYFQNIEHIIIIMIASQFFCFLSQNGKPARMVLLILLLMVVVVMVVVALAAAFSLYATDKKQAKRKKKKYRIPFEVFISN